MWSMTVVVFLMRLLGRIGEMLSGTNSCWPWDQAVGKFDEEIEKTQRLSKDYYNIGENVLQLGAPRLGLWAREDESSKTTTPDRVPSHGKFRNILEVQNMIM